MAESHLEKEMVVQSHLVQARWLPEAGGFEPRRRLMNMVYCVDQG